MDWAYRRLLIAEDRLSAAAGFRIRVGLVAMAVGSATCLSGIVAPNPAGVGVFMGGLLLVFFSLISLGWRRERGLWMMYTFLAACSVFMYSITAKNQGARPASATSLPLVTMLDIGDMVIGGCLFIMAIRLLLSAAVANYRRFATKPPDPPATQPPTS